MNAFTWIFLLALAANLALEYWLLWRQARAVAGHRDRVPEPFAGRISLEQHRKAADYTLARITHARVSQFVGVVLLLAWTLGGGLDLLDRLWQETHLDTLWQGVGLLMSVLTLSTLLELPLGLWSTFGIEARFGFNRTTPRQFLVDLLLQFLLMLLVGIPLVAVFLWLMERAGSHWWLWAWAVWTVFTLFITWAWPTLIAPLFNKFTPLQDPALKKRLEALLERCGFRSKGMFVMDGSKRSSHGNAYFTGFGRNKRIVFFDTLLDSLEPDEVEAVLAHELGHFRKHHVLKMMLVMAVLSFLGLALMGWLIQQPWFYQGLGVSRQTPALGLALFLLVLPVFSTLFTPVFAAMSRKQEFEADDYAALQADARALIDALVKMYRDNASTLTPDRLYSLFHHSHPPAAVRIGHLSSRINEKQQQEVRT
ncbi:MAG: M48 family peptidase [Gammaproteobacteria bacterium]|nr:MAG: M48 family peptidase [Gammaproteobacteria bacterium]